MRTKVQETSDPTAVDGRRRIGLRLELVGSDFHHCVRASAHLFGGDVRLIGEGHVVIEETRIGTVDIREGPQCAASAYKLPLRHFGLPESAFNHLALASLIEIATESMPTGELARFDELLTQLNAEDRQKSGIFGFRLQLDPRLTSKAAAHILAIMKAFCLVNPWRRATSSPASNGRFRGWSRPWPANYRRMILDPHYRPDIETLIGDYLCDVGTAHTDLDMLPLFAALKGDLVRTALPELRIRPQPALRYQPPTVRMDGLKSPVVDGWNTWVTVERIAADRRRLDGFCAAYAGRGETMSGTAWLQEVGSAVA